MTFDAGRARRWARPTGCVTLRRRTWAVAGVMMVSAGLANAVKAAEAVCVACSDPPQIYECLLPDELGQTNPGQLRRGATFLCIETIAKARQHRACGVRKGVQGPCIGERIALQDLLGPASSGVMTATPPGPTAPSASGAETPAQPAPTEPTEAEPPKTMAELAKRAATATQRQFSETNQKLKDASDDVGSFMSDSWRCVTSLFSNCGKQD